jgi:hypothetical protein
MQPSPRHLDKVELRLTRVYTGRPGCRPPGGGGGPVGMFIVGFSLTALGEFSVVQQALASRSQAQSGIDRLVIRWPVTETT